MLQHFRKPRWRHAKPAVRREAVGQLSPRGEEDAILRELAASDADPGVRRAAVKKLSDLALLRQRMEQDADSGVAEAAAVRYRQLLAGGSGGDDLQLRVDELDRCPNPRVLAHVLRGAREEVLRLAALERCADQSVLADAAVNDPVARVRQAAVARLSDPAMLERVAQRTYQGDRRISRMARYMLREQEEDARARAARAKERAEVLEALQALQVAERSPHSGTLARLENRWQAAAEDAESDESARFGTLLAECRTLADRPPPEAGTGGQAPDALVTDIAWPEAAAQPPVLSDAESTIEMSAKPAPAEAARSEPPERFEALNAHLRAVDQALQKGNLRKAQHALHKARDELEALPAGAARRSEREVRRYTARVAELRDWRRFATLPKQEALCERMEALIGADMPPPERAAAIKSLQDEWKETGGSDSAESRQLWQRFQAASDSAFEPCRAYFDAQAEQRAANLAERERIADELESFMSEADWAAMDTGKLVEIRGKAREEWNRFSPVEHGAAKPVSRRFEALMDRLTERIKAGQEESRRQKAALLEQARALGEIDSLQQRLEQAKALQSEWRRLGPAQPAQERKLHRAFKAACDAVFAERDQDRRAEQARRQENKAQAERLCEELEALPGDDGRDETALAERMASAEAAFEALGPLPGGVRDGVERRFRKAAAAVRRHLTEQQARETERTYEALRRRAAVCARLEAAVQAGEGAAPQRLQADWESAGDAPEALLEPVAARWARAVEAAAAGGFSEARLQAATDRAHRLCVAMEILAGVDSPEADAGLRMKLQVERLSEGLGGGDGGSAEDAREPVRALELDWLANGPLPEQTLEALESRFNAARDVALRQATNLC